MTICIAKIIIAISCFSKRSFGDVWQGSECSSSSEYPRTLNSQGFWICLWIWMFQSFEYARVLNIPGLHRVQKMADGFNMPDYVWICLNIPKYAWICLNLPEWLLFYISPFPICFAIFCLLEHVIAYILIEVIVWRSMKPFYWREKI